MSRPEPETLAFAGIMTVVVALTLLLTECGAAQSATYSGELATCVSLAPSYDAGVTCLERVHQVWCAKDGLLPPDAGPCLDGGL